MCLLQGLCFEHVLYPWRHAFLVFITSERSRTAFTAVLHSRRTPCPSIAAATHRGILCSSKFLDYLPPFAILRQPSPALAQDSNLTLQTHQPVQPEHPPLPPPQDQR